MVDRDSEIPVAKQCQLLGLKRGRVYHVRHVSPKKQELLDRVDELAAQIGQSRAAVINLAILQMLKIGVKIDGAAG